MRKVTDLDVKDTKLLVDLKILDLKVCLHAEFLLASDEKCITSSCDKHTSNQTLVDFQPEH